MNVEEEEINAFNNSDISSWGEILMDRAIDDIFD
jgi:hypothetical protein